MNHLPGLPLGALTPLYGREPDLRQVLKLLQSGVRLLTLRGPGGIGKTALALHLAHALKAPGQSPPLEHVQVIDLSAVREPEAVLGLIAASLPESDLRGTPERRLQDFVARCRTVLILDNFEQLLPAAPGLGDLLASTRTLQLVVTSRARCDFMTRWSTRWSPWPCLSGSATPLQALQCSSLWHACRP